MTHASHHAIASVDASLRGARRRDARARGVRAWLRDIASVMRTVVGAPDYERYERHVRERHPECEPLTRDEFVRQRMDSRYSRPGSRCC